MSRGTIGGGGSGTVVDQTARDAAAAALTTAQAAQANVVPVSEGNTWSASASYSPNTVITYLGSRYMSVAAVPAATIFDPSKWVLLAAAPDTF